MKSNFNKSKRWAPKSNKKRDLKEVRPKPAPVKDKKIDLEKILEIQKNIKKKKD